jgi:hypothetical protein
MPGPVPVTHPASGVAQGLPPPTAMPPPVRNIPGGINIGDRRGGTGDDEDLEEDEEEPGSPSDDNPISPLVSRGSQGHPGMQQNQRTPPSVGQSGLQRHTSHHGAPGQPRPTAGTNHSARGAHHGAHPYAGGGGPVRETGHRRRTSSAGAGQGGPGGQQGKVTSPRLMQRQTSGMSEGGGQKLDTQSPTMAHYPPHPGHDPAMYGQYQGPPSDGQQPGRMMPPYPPQQQQQHAAPGNWGQVQQGVHPGHRR